MKKIVRVEVIGGVASVTGAIPKGVMVILRDYDCEGCDSKLEDESGTHYHEMTFEHDS